MLLLVLINVITFTSVDNFNTIFWYSQPLEYLNDSLLYSQPSEYQLSVFQTLWNTDYYYSLVYSKPYGIHEYYHSLVYSKPYEILSIIIV